MNFLKRLFLFVRLYAFFKRHLIHLTPFVNFSENTKFEGSNSVGKRTNIVNSKIGFATYIGDNCNLQNADIGRFTSIANDVRIVTNNHPTSQYVSTHPAFHRGDAPLMKALQLSFNLDCIYPETTLIRDSFQVVIGSDVWIGESVKIMPGITIGNGAVVAAGAVVTKDVKSYSIVGGIPSKHIKFRFSDAEIKALESIQWWNWDISKIEMQQAQFKSLEQFLKNNCNLN
ncbi:CatB-related O-acetyltransferase [Shewanella sp. SR1]|uniref:CatB-related O-acetyltransferase n=1 Tax=Shewanella sp. SR1 TaxID=2855505 RepID=UPI001CF5D399|nr:CatB-related O-acetyltransferase [Shewanella sp. SR1]MCB2381941.1 CatB-related O-acetyltransferase [Shewanella sp. SR1]